MTEPQRSRAVFSMADFKTIRRLLVHFIENQDHELYADLKNDERFWKDVANLYHRLGRVDDET